MSRPVVDEHPESEFQRQARELLERVLAAKTKGERMAREAELGALLRANRTRSAWDAMRDAEAVEQPAADVSRATSRDRSCHTLRASSDHADDVVDRKVAAAGRDSD